MPALNHSDCPLLLVDDDLLTREVLTLLIADAGFPVQSFESGEAVLAYLHAAPARPFAILIDMQMPGLQGDPLAEQLRALCGPGTLLLAMSGTAVDPSATRHFDTFLLKPFSIQELSTVLTHSPQTSASSSSPQEMLSETTYQSLAQSLSAVQLLELYAMCLDDADRRIQLMRQASAPGEGGRRDEDAFRRSAHAIKGGCGMVGALELAAIAGHMEEAGLPSIDDKGPFDGFLAASARLRRMLDARIR